MGFPNSTTPLKANNRCKDSPDPTIVLISIRIPSRKGAQTIISHRR